MVTNLPMALGNWFNWHQTSSVLCTSLMLYLYPNFLAEGYDIATAGQISMHFAIAEHIYTSNSLNEVRSDS